MAGLVSSLLLLTIHYISLDCTKRTLRLVYERYSPELCRELCQDFPGTYYFVHDDRECHQTSRYSSTGSIQDSPKSCLIEDRRTNNKPAFALKTGLDVCRHLYEDVYQPEPLHLTIEDTRGGDLPVNHISHNMSLHQACEDGRLCTVQYIVSQRPADINTRDKLGRTPIIAAVMRHQVNVFDFLVSQSCDMMTVDNNNDTVLHVACDVGNVDIVRKLVVNQAYDIESRGKMGRTPLMRSALHGHRDVFDLLVSLGCNANALDDNMNNILHVSCSGGYVGMVKDAVSKFNFGTENRGEKGRTPIMIAAHRGHTGVFDFLASNGSNMFAIDDFKDNILHVACIGGHVDMVQHVLNTTSIGIECKGNHGQTPVMRAAQYGRISVFNFLGNKHCNLKAVDDNNNNLLHVACIGGSLTMVQRILLKLKQIDSRGQNGQTPVMIAARQGHRNVVEYILSEGCNLSLVDKYGNNVLHVSCMVDRVDMVKLILSQTNISIDSRSRGQIGQTPVMCAAYYGHKSVFMFLANQGCNLMILDGHRNSILHVACMGGHVDMVKHIVGKEASEKDSRGQNGQTPVMLAASLGHMSVFMFLLNQGCDLRLLDGHNNNILHIACMGGHIVIVKYIVEKEDIGINSRGQYGRTPVMLAAQSGNIDVVRYLVSKGCNMSVVDANGNNMLHIACLGTSVDMVKYILSQTNIGMNSRGHYRRTPVMISAEHGHIHVVRYLVSKGCGLSFMDSHRNSLLHVACLSGGVDIVKYILSQMKTGLNSKGQNGRTPVMLAARLGHVNVVKYLIDAGSKTSIVDGSGDTVLHMACVSSSIDMVKHILTHTNIGIDSLGQYGRTPVMLAARLGHKDVVKYLASKNCKLAILDLNRNNMLHMACKSGNLDMVKYTLSETNTEVESRGKNGRTSVMLAARFGYMDIVKYLVNKRCRLTPVDANGNNMLHMACKSGNLELVKYTLSKTNIEVDSRGENGWTPVLLAASFGHKSIVVYLINKRCTLSVVDSHQNNILHAACVSGNVEMVKYVLSQIKIGIDSRGRYGRTPVMAAAGLGRMDVVKYLVRKGCKLSIVDSNRDTILHVVCMSSTVDMVKYILSQRKIGIESRGQLGRTPVMHAAAFGNINVVKYLVGRGCKLGKVDWNGLHALEMACVGRHEHAVRYLKSIRRWSKAC